MESHRESYYTTDHVFDGNMMFAFGLTAYDNEQEIIEDPSIGILRPYYISWGLSDIDSSDTDLTPLRYH